MTPTEFYELIPRNRVEECVRATLSPSYLFFLPVIERQFSQLRAGLGERFDVHFAVKANPNEQILRALCELGAGADVASNSELAAALNAGYDPKRIEFSGPGKTMSELEEAIRAGIGAINIESLQELDYLFDLAKRHGMRPKVGIRVNPAIKARAGLKMAGATQFGLPEQDLAAALKRCREGNRFLDFVGLHLHLGSQVLDLDSILETVRTALRITSETVAVIGKPLAKLNLGGGWGVSYFEGQASLDINAVCRGVNALLDDPRITPTLKDTRLIVEPGRYLVAESGVYATQVLYCKDAGSKQFSIVDGGMHHNYLLAGGMGQVIRRNFFFDVLPAVTNSNITQAQSYDLNVSGCLCTPQDVLLQNAPHHRPLAPGDHVLFFNCGAYGMSASPTDFLGHDRATEVLVSG